jgi:DNA-directed RNA polymerase specialized sigma24 family protein
MTAETPREPLTPHETVVLAAAAIGMTPDATARRMGASTRTVRRLQHSAVGKLGAAALIHAVALAVLHGLINPQQVRDRIPPTFPPYDRHAALRKVKRSHAALTPQQIAEATRLRGEGWSYRAIASHFGVAYSTARSTLLNHKREAAA